MNLDDIIKLAQPGVGGCLRDGPLRNLKKKIKDVKKRDQVPPDNHSVPLLSSLGGGYIYVTKKSPLLSANRRRVMQTVPNGVFHSELPDKTNTGLGSRLRPLKKSNNSQSNDSIKDCPPPLTNSPVYLYSRPSMETQTESESDDEIIILECENFKKKPPVIDVESNMPLDDVMESAQEFLAQKKNGMGFNSNMTLLT